MTKHNTMTAIQEILAKHGKLTANDICRKLSDTYSIGLPLEGFSEYAKHFTATTKITRNTLALTFARGKGIKIPSHETRIYYQLEGTV